MKKKAKKGKSLKATITKILKTKPGKRIMNSRAGMKLSKWLKMPNLKGRVAVCPHCRKAVPSKWDLPLFKYRGAERRIASPLICKNCGKQEYQHRDAKYYGTCDKFVPGYMLVSPPMEKDEFYCGCRGWS